ncbi:MAG: 4Fe-4S ferredoxin, partial [Deltaproteobacteria bacterium]
AAMFVRRVYGKHILPRAAHLDRRVSEVKGGKYEKALKDLAAMKQEEVKKLYVEREREPDLVEPGKWMPRDVTNL